MIRFKNNNGFTLIEVLVAIAIIGMAIMPIVFLQTAVLTRVNRGMHQLQRLLFAKKFLEDAREKNKDNSPEFSLEKQELDPVTLLIYRAQPTNYPQIKELDGLCTQKVIARWKDGNVQRNTTLVTFAFHPEKEQQT